MAVRITTLQEEVKNIKNNLERVEAERKQAQDMLNHSEKVWWNDVEADALYQLLTVFSNIIDVSKSSVAALNQSCV